MSTQFKQNVIIKPRQSKNKLSYSEVSFQQLCFRTCFPTLKNISLLDGAYCYLVPYVVSMYIS